MDNWPETAAHIVEFLEMNAYTEKELETCQALASDKWSSRQYDIVLQLLGEMRHIRRRLEALEKPKRRKGKYD